MEYDKFSAARTPPWYQGDTRYDNCKTDYYETSNNPPFSFFASHSVAQSRTDDSIYDTMIYANLT
eukprot:scaffold114338_cov55-Attheya_sp.AAC.3